MRKRVNQGYEIKQSIQVGSAEFVLGEHPKAPSRFATWQCRDQDDYFFGHYHNDLLKAVKDLCERAMSEIEYLEQKETERNSIKKDQKEPKQRKVQKDRDEER